MGKVNQDVCIVIGAFMSVWGMTFLVYYSIGEIPILASEISLIAAIMLTPGGIIVMYIGDRSGRPPRMASEQ
jgi:hypothetical protein